MCSYMVWPDDIDDSLDLDLAQLSMDFDAAGMFDDPLLQAKLPSLSEVPAPPTEGLAFDPRQSARALFTQQTPYVDQAQKKAGSRLSRTREKNRLAQARYRERQKQELADTQAKVERAQAMLSTAKDRLQGCQAVNEKLVRRAAESASALLALMATSAKPQPPTANTSSSTALPRPAASDPGVADSPSSPWLSQMQPPREPAAVSVGGAPSSRPPTTPAHSGGSNGGSNAEVSTRHPASAAPQQPSNLNHPLPVSLPKQRPLPPSAHCAPLHGADLFSDLFTDPFFGIRSLPGAGASTSDDAAPLPGQPPWPESEASSTNRFNLVGSTAAVAAASAAAGDSVEIRLVETVIADAAARVRAYRCRVAADAGVSESNVYWVLQIPYQVSPREGAGDAVGSEPGAPVAMACCTAIVSPACMASLFTLFVCSRFEGACLAAALDRRSWPPAKSQASTAAMVEDSLAKLDGIIQRTPVSQAHGRCGTTGRFLLSEGVPAVVRAIAARYRHRMPAPVWAAVCSQFVDFVVSKQPPEGAQPACPLAALFDYPDEATQCGEGSDAQGAQAADGSLARLPDGTPNRCSTGRCPKCCVVASLVRELRDIIAEEEQTPQPQQITADATVDVSDDRKQLWARARELYASFAVLLSQTLIDAPLLMRHLLLASSAASLVHAQAEMMDLEFYKTLRLSKAQHSVAVAVWQVWLGHRAAVSKRFREALTRLAALPNTSGLPMEELQQLTEAPQTCGSSVLYLGQHAPHEPEQPCAASAVPSHARRHCCGLRGPWQQRLLGSSGVETAAADAALGELRSTHAEAAEKLADMTRALCLPGAILSLEQLVRQVPVALRFGRPMVDWLQLCRSAAREQEHNALLKPFA